VSAAASLDALVADAGFHDDPYPALRAMRRDDPVHWCEPWQQWLVTRYDDVRAVLLDPGAFSSAGYELRYLDRLPPDVREAVPHLRRQHSTPVLSTSDPPRHGPLRRPLARSLTPHVLEALRPGVEALVERTLDEIEGEHEVDLLARFAYPVPAVVIAQLLGVPENDRASFIAWSGDVVGFQGSGQPTVERARRADASLGDFTAYLEALIAERRAHPGDGLLDLLLAPGDLPDRELVATCVVLLFAGHETTANLIATGLRRLLEHPDQLDRLRDGEVGWDEAVEELLRYDGPVPRVRRVAAQDVVLGGRHVGAGDLVMAFLASANRDETRFAAPDVLDLGRADAGHVGFGYGIHFCVGAALTRLEAPIALRAVLRRFPGLRLVPGVPARFKANLAFRGLEALPVLLT
jgi:cytochrome P450